MNLDDFKNFVAIDLETTGLDKEKDKIIEIALCRFVNGEPTESFSHLINPDKEVRSFIIELTGLNAEELKHAPSAKEVLQEALDFIGNSPLVAHNADVDKHFLKKELEHCGFNGFNNTFWDSLFISRLVWTDCPNHKLETLVKYLNLEKVEAHRALPDAIQSGLVFSMGIEKMKGFSNEVNQCLAWLAQGTYYSNFFEKAPKNPPLIPSPLGTDEINEPQFIDFNSWENLYSEEGAFAKLKENYQFRPQQIEISQSIENSFASNKILSLEAPTGSGKTLAYLSAAAKRVGENKERIVIATATRTLQNQIAQSEIPLLKTIFKDVSFQVLKGKENYLCRRKLQDLINSAKAHLTPQDRTHVMTLIPWLAKTITGDVGENSSFHSSRCIHIWRLISGEAQSCNSLLCKDQHCYSDLAYSQAEKANILIVNHALLLKDIQFDFSVLPTWDRLIIDEAHRFANNAHQHLGKEVWFYRFRSILHQINNAQVDTPLILEISNQLDDLPEIQALAQRLHETFKESEKSFHRFLMKVGRRLKNEKAEFYTFNQPLAQLLNLPYHDLCEQINILISQVDEFIEKAPLKIQNFISPLKVFKSQLREFNNDLNHIFETRNSDETYWLTDWNNPHLLRLHSKPIELKAFFKGLLPWAKSIVFTSATLTVKDSFNYFHEQMGIDTQQKPCEVLQLKSTWPLEKNRKIIVVDYLANPSDKEFQDQLDQVLVEILPKIKGSTLCLYTSIRSLKNSHRALTTPLEEAHKFLLGQHLDGTIENLTGLFKQKEGSVLLGTQIFWEGVDLPGKQLENLIITKLPFPTPNEPLILAKSERLKENKRNPFKELFVPEALMELQQGMGRLIRRAEDKGTIVLFDNRILTQAYGKSFQRLWNNQHIRVSNLEQLKEALNA